MNKLNVAQIVSIKAYMKLKNDRYEYKKAKWIWFWYQKEGYYRTYFFGSDDYVTEAEILKKDYNYIENRVVYYKPFLQFRVSDGRIIEKFFETEADLTAYVESEELKVNRWITL